MGDILIILMYIFEDSIVECKICVIFVVRIKIYYFCW